MQLFIKTHLQKKCQPKAKKVFSKDFLAKKEIN
jgi:hypothetical protein